MNKLRHLLICLSFFLISGQIAHAFTIPEGTKLYLDGGGATLWNQDNAWFSVHFFNSMTANYTNVRMEATTHENVYSVITPAGGPWDKFSFFRMDVNCTGYANICVWNNTLDLDYDGYNNLYTIYAFSDSKLSYGFWGQSNFCTIDSLSVHLIESDGETYSIEGEVTFSEFPSGGSLIVSDSESSSLSHTTYYPFLSSSHYEISGIPVDRTNPITYVSAYFSFGSCSSYAYYQAPTTSDSLSCVGDEKTFRASSQGTYLWNTEDTTPEILVQTDTTKTYICNILDNDGNETIEVFRNTVETLPRVSFEFPLEICSNSEELIIPFDIEEGSPSLYSLQFDDPLFEDATNLPLSNTNIKYELPEGLENKTYRAKLQFISDPAHCTQDSSFNFEIDSSLIYAKWTDVLFCDNGGLDFIDYKWYHNDTLLIAENKQHIYDFNGFSGDYQVIATRADESKVKSCILTYDYIPKSKDSGRIYPIPALSRKAIQIDLPTPSVNASKIKLEIYNLIGELIFKKINPTDKIQIFLNTGKYLFLYSEDEHKIWQEKLIVK